MGSSRIIPDPIGERCGVRPRAEPRRAGLRRAGVGVGAAPFSAARGPRGSAGARAGVPGCSPMVIGALTEFPPRREPAGSGCIIPAPGRLRWPGIITHPAAPRKSGPGRGKAQPPQSPAAPLVPTRPPRLLPTLLFLGPAANSPSEGVWAPKGDPEGLGTFPDRGDTAGAAKGSCPPLPAQVPPERAAIKRELMT